MKGRLFGTAVAMALGGIVCGCGATSQREEIVAAPGQAPAAGAERLSEGALLLTERNPGAALSRQTVFADLGVTRLRAVKGGEALFSLEAVSSVAARTEGAIAATNADFFEEDNSPTGMFVSEAGVWRGPWLGVTGTAKLEGSPAGQTERVHRPVLAWDDEGHVFLGVPTVTIRVLGPASESLIVDAVNVVQKKEIDAAPPIVTVFNHLLGKEAPATGDGESAAVIILERVPWLPNRVVKGYVASTGGQDAVAMDARTVVVHAVGGLPAWMTKGSTIALTADFSQLPGTVTGVLGGLPMLVHEGKNVALEEAARENFPLTVATTKQPRTAVGLRRNGRELVLAVWDGRHVERAGATLEEMADYMITAGCKEAMSFDGGGSSQMIGGGKLINQPSDLKEDGAAGEVGNMLVITRRERGQPAR